MKANPFWVDCKHPYPIVNGVIIYCDAADDLPEVDSVVKYYLTVPIKFLIYDGISEQKDYESMWKIKGIKKSLPNEIISLIMNAHNDLVKLVSKVFTEFDKDKSGFIELNEI